MVQAFIQAIGTAVPSYKISQELHHAVLESANGMTNEQKQVLKKIYKRSGINCRYSVLDEFGAEDAAANLLFHPSGLYPATSVSKRMEIYEEQAPVLCKEAVTSCMNKLPLLAYKDITHLVTFSCTGMFAPGLDILLTEQLGMERNLERTCINFMGCYAAINALKSAYHIIRSQPEAIVMLVGVELCSLHYQRSYEPNQMVANALFGDGAAAVIVSSAMSNDNHIRLSLEDFYAEFEHSASNNMVWRIGDTGFDLQLTPEVPNIVRKNIGGLLEKLFKKTGITQEDIDYYAIHPGGVKILEVCEHALQLSKNQNKISYDILHDYGNMSSVTILFVLHKYMNMLVKEDKGKSILVCAFGPGITMESMILKVC